MAAKQPIAFRAHEFGSAGVFEMEGQKLLTFRLTVLYKLISRQASRFLGKHFDLSIAEWWILAQLGEHSPRTLRQLAEITHADKAQLSRASAALLKKGLLRREPDPKDARSVLFSITPEGGAVKDAVKPVRRAFNQGLLDRLTEDERSALDSAIDTLIDFLQADTEAG